MAAADGTDPGEACEPGAFRRVARHGDLVRLLVGWALWSAADWLTLVVLAAHAFAVRGAAGVAVLGAAGTASAAIITPMVAVAADRFSRPRVLTATAAVGGGAMAATAWLVHADQPLAAIVGAAAVWAVTVASYRPTSTALLPTVVRVPGDLVAYNAVWMTVDSAGSLAGPLVAAVALSVLGPGPALSIAAGAALSSAIAFAGISDVTTARRPTSLSRMRTLTAGFRAIAEQPTARLLVGLGMAQTTVGGGLQLLLVIVAVERTGMGDRGVGLLYAAIGFGGLVGSLATVRLVGTRHLALVGGLGLVLWGSPFAVLAAVGNPPAALAVVGVVGVGNVFVDICVLTLLQRSVADEVLARVMGALETLIQATRAAGAVLAALLVGALGNGSALVVIGCVLPACAVASLPALRRVDRRTADRNADLELLRDVALFSRLPVVTAELLASHLDRHEIAAGQTIVRQGDPGDRYYVVEDGEATVAVDGTVVASVRRGDGFGELALLRTDRRTATVRATVPAVVRSIERDLFLLVVTGDPAASAAADAASEQYTPATPDRTPEPT